MNSQQHVDETLSAVSKPSVPRTEFAASCLPKRKQRGFVDTCFYVSRRVQTWGSAPRALARLLRDLDHARFVCVLLIEQGRQARRYVSLSSPRTHFHFANRFQSHSMSRHGECREVFARLPCSDCIQAHPRSHINLNKLLRIGIALNYPSKNEHTLRAPWNSC